MFYWLYTKLFGGDECFDDELSSSPEHKSGSLSPKRKISLVLEAKKSDSDDVKLVIAKAVTVNKLSSHPKIRSALKVITSQIILVYG